MLVYVGLHIAGLFKPGVSFTSRTHMCGDLTSADISKHVKLCGWLQYQRMNGRFLVLRDAVGTVQVAVLNSKVRRITFFYDVLSILVRRRLACVVCVWKPLATASNVMVCCLAANGAIQGSSSSFTAVALLFESTWCIINKECSLLTQTN